MTITTAYLERRGQIENYFDRTAVEAWKRLTSDAPVGRIRATVRAGRTTMRETLLEWLPMDLTGKRLLDAGCGTGALAIEAARRGAQVVAVDLSPTLIDLANERMPTDVVHGSVRFLAGDMLDPGLGQFDYVVAMDSLIHDRALDVVHLWADLAQRTNDALLFTFAPRTRSLAVMHAVGRLFPRGDRAPSIEPVPERTLHRLIGHERGLAGWQPVRTRRVTCGFYTSQALEIKRA